MLKDLKVHGYQKIGLAFVFSLAVVIVTLDILRTVQALVQHQALYTILEINLVVIVSCLPAYRALLSKGGQRSHSLNRQSRFPSWRTRSYSRPFRTQDSDGHPLRRNRGKGLESSSEAIRVTKGFAVSNHGRCDPYLLESLDLPSREQTPPELAHMQKVYLSTDSNAV